VQIRGGVADWYWTADLVDSSDLHPHLHMNNIQLPRSIQHIASGWLLELASAGC